MGLSVPSSGLFYPSGLNRQTVHNPYDYQQVMAKNSSLDSLLSYQFFTGDPGRQQIVEQQASSDNSFEQNNNININNNSNNNNNNNNSNNNSDGLKMSQVVVGVC